MDADGSSLQLGEWRVRFMDHSVAGKLSISDLPSQDPASHVIEQLRKALQLSKDPGAELKLDLPSGSATVVFKDKAAYANTLELTHANTRVGGSIVYWRPVYTHPIIHGTSIPILRHTHWDFSILFAVRNHTVPGFLMRDTLREIVWTEN